MLVRPERRIELRPEGGLFVVEVLPPPFDGANFDATFANYVSARDHAASVGKVTEWKVIDLCQRNRWIEVSTEHELAQVRALGVFAVFTSDPARRLGYRGGNIEF
jgi:hypothetical protein